jgi:hypothetical protein
LLRQLLRLSALVHKSAGDPNLPLAFYLHLKSIVLALLAQALRLCSLWLLGQLVFQLVLLAVHSRFLMVMPESLPFRVQFLLTTHNSLFY